MAKGSRLTASSFPNTVTIMSKGKPFDRPLDLEPETGLTGDVRSVQETFRVTEEEHLSLVKQKVASKTRSMSKFFRDKLGLAK